MWWDYWPMPFFFPGIMILMVIFCFVMMAGMMMRGGHSRGASHALEILNERYARGEINKAEYDERRRVLEA
jgi:putative membrane protein